MDEHVRSVSSGWVMLPLVIGLFLLAPLLLFVGVRGMPLALLSAVVVFVLAWLLAKGLFTLQPNEARVLVLFGLYTGTVKQAGFHWANPFSVHRGPWEAVQAKEKGEGVSVRAKSRYKVSLRVRNFETQVLKVNDQRGNPIEIGAVVVWCVRDTAKALFDVDDYENYVEIQSETALRHLANSFPYDNADDGPGQEMTLRGDTDAISAALAKELQARLASAGMMVEEARLTHLAYAPEIAGVMLRRQQAEAIIAARQKIVHGAVSMVQMALSELADKGVVTLDETQKAAMVGNLLVVLCGESQVEPVVNTGVSVK